MISINLLFLYILYTLHSTNASLPHLERQKIRKAGRCVKGCRFGYTTTPSAPTNSNAKYKNILEFESLLSSYTSFEQSYDAYTKNLTEMNLPNKFGLDDKFHLSTLFQYCNSLEESFEYCMGRTKEILLYEQAYECYSSCMEKPSQEIEFESSAYPHQQFETCLDEYKPQYFTPPSPPEQMMEAYKTTGFLIIENFFEKQLMNEVTYTLNAWRKLKTWQNLNFTKYAFDEYIPTNANRFEVILPFLDPFKSLVTQLKTLDLPFEELDIVSATASLPGAIQQTKYRNTLSKETVFQIIPHDSLLQNGIVSFCPCTHHHARSFDFFTLENECPVSETPELKAGSLIVYDGALMHFENRNYGGIVRWNVEVNFGVDSLWSVEEEVLGSVRDYRDL